MNRIQASALLVIGLVFLSGCAGVMDGEVKFTAKPAGLSDSYVEQSSFTEQSIQEKTIVKNVTVKGKEVEVTISGWKSRYKSDEIGVSVISFPQVSVGGKPLNPLATQSTESIVRVVMKELHVGNLENKGSTTVEIVGKDVVVEKYSGTVTVQGQKVPITLHVAKFTHKDDVIVTIGMYPKKVEGQQKVLEAISHIEHPIEVESNES